MKGKLKFWLPAGIFVVLTVVLGIGLTLDPREVPSPLIDEPAPPFQLSRLSDPATSFAPADMRGKVWVLNVWASWCVSCRAEHEVLKVLAAEKLVPIVGLNYKDRPQDARQWLDRLGDPYELSVMDNDGRAGIDWGVYGVPETFIIDQQGTIRYKHIGPVDLPALTQVLIPKIKTLTQEASRSSVRRS
ncbi:MAG: DsbE family thiol:disulfide interchange protein [Gemmatimonadales bacterium]